MDKSTEDVANGMETGVSQLNLVPKFRQRKWTGLEKVVCLLAFVFFVLFIIFAVLYGLKANETREAIKTDKGRTIDMVAVSYVSLKTV